MFHKQNTSKMKDLIFSRKYKKLNLQSSKRNSLFAKLLFLVFISKFFHLKKYNKFFLQE